jgi:hypothetical protein
MATYWTIVAGGHEKTLEDWGVNNDWTVTRASKGKATAILRTVEDFDGGATQWAFKDKIIIYRDRASSTGAEDSFSSGSIYFQGYADEPERIADGGLENVRYQVHNVWWLFERNPFKQYRMQFAGWDSTHQRVVVSSIHAAGSGYTVGDVLTVVGGTGTAAQLTVLAVSSGAVGIVAVSNGGGSYTVLPSNPVTMSGGSGSGCTLDLTFGQVPTLTQLVTSEVFLGENLHAGAGYTSQWDNGSQIGEIVDWMNETYNPTKRGATIGRDDSQDVVIKGTIDPHTNMPVTRFNGSFCSDAVAACLRWDPDAVIVEDPTTAPPTIHVRKLAKWNYGTVPPTFIDYTNLTEVTVTLTSDQERQLLVQGQLGRVLPGVIIYYKSVDIIDSTIVPRTVVDKYPGGITDYTPEASSHTVELGGAKVVHQSASVTVKSIADLLSGTAANRKAWWLAHDVTLTEPGVKASTIAAGTATIVDDAGSAIDTTGLSELDTRHVPDWVGVRTIRAHVSATISFERYADGSSQHIQDAKTSTRVHTKVIILTDATTQVYTALVENTAAELVPTGVAESVYRSGAATQFAGRVTFVNDPLRSDISLGKRLKFIGPTTTFTNLLVQAIETYPGFGETTVTFGPSTPLDVDMWVELTRATRARLTYNLPSGRGDGGTSSSGQSLNAGAVPPADNTAHGVSGLSYFAVVYQQS